MSNTHERMQQIGFNSRLGSGVLMAVALTALMALTAGGCQRQLLPSDVNRSQFSQYDVVRNQAVPAYQRDEFGRKRPNLRGRLLTSE